MTISTRSGYEYTLIGSGLTPYERRYTALTTASSMASTCLYVEHPSAVPVTRVST